MALIKLVLTSARAAAAANDDNDSDDDAQTTHGDKTHESETAAHSTCFTESES